MDDALERIETVLGAMASGGPRDLRAYLQQPGPDFEKVDSGVVDGILDLLLSSDPNNPARLRFSHVLRSWDNAKDASWASGTQRNTDGRRNRIHELLRLGLIFQQRIDGVLPFYRLSEPLIIAEDHQDWYRPQPGVRDYYWDTYVGYLRERRGWEGPSLLDLDNSTCAIVECLANPESSAAYASRGLVMGYVQSGKTANFMGVVARAADAGYRLIIVLAGTWNILRNQTQRRFDKELLGKELLRSDQAYMFAPPPDWGEFLEHGSDPVERGQYTWQRLTRPDIDFKSLKAAIDSLEFDRINKAAPIYEPSNLHALAVKLLVVKKHSGILANLVRDLKLLRTRLTDLPTLVIDDESDQAGLNTVDPAGNATEKKKRSITNQRIVELLRLFPRGQYVGYTATPYANALVDADDPEDLFPKDFIIPLDRPRGYMGVSDFFDPTTDYNDLRKNDFSQPEIAFIRRVENPLGADDDDLKQALRSYVLAGGAKLYRHATDARRYKAEHVKHHTMLVHTSQLKGEQASIATRIEDLWNQCAFNTHGGLIALEELWNRDHVKVAAVIGTEATPGSFTELIPHLSECIKRIERGPRILFVVNSEKAPAPDFSAAPVWKIVVGGNKLSRGYTIEGLTVSYYRRVAGTADTLMQMGRWFGFRPGYQDLVRVFLGVKEGKRGNSDLVSLFKEVCRMEERFRDEIRRYVGRAGAPRITPKQIPPLIAVSGSLPPTASNKMFNAKLAGKNFGGQRSMLTLTSAKPTGMQKNIEATEALLSGGKSVGTKVLGGTSKNGTPLESTAVVLAATTDQLMSFLQAYHWLESEYKYPERPTDTSLQIEFLKGEKHGITGWLIVAPQRKVSFGPPLAVEGLGDLAVKERHRIEGRGFQVFGEPVHRRIAEFLVGVEEGAVELASPNAETQALQDPHRGVCLIYPVRELPSDKISIGFELVFPSNDLPFDINFTVRRKADRKQVVVQE